MSKILDLGNGFYNIRGIFKIFRLVDVGTHSSLIKLKSGKFMMVDCIHIENGSPVHSQILEMTQNGNDIESIVNLHPFHTVSIKSVHSMFPNAKLYGTQRHHTLFNDLPWQPELTESEDFKKLFEDDIDVSVSKGLLLEVPNNPNVHSGSVLLYHKASKSVHVDDTIGYLSHVPGLISWMTGYSTGQVMIHPGISQALEKRSGAADEFREWMKNLFVNWDVKNLCTAHSGALCEKDNPVPSISERVLEALSQVENTLKHHSNKYKDS